MSSFHCNRCDIRIPKYRPLLLCSICKETKHYKCNNMSKNEASTIIMNGYMAYWTCQDCITSLFPATLYKQTIKNIHDTTKHDVIPVMCAACNKPCSCNQTINCQTCGWCEKPCHKKCIKNSLGCLDCCNNMIPGYNYEAYQINNSLHTNTNSVVFSPYDHTCLFNQIGDKMHVEEEGPVWSEIANQLKTCKYIEAKNIKMGRTNELKIMSLNIRSLNKNIDYIRENLNEFNKFDILCFNETNCNVDCLPNGLNDIVIDGFHTPFTQNPNRASNKGGGLSIYVHQRVCDNTDLELLDLKLDSTTTNRSPNCEYIFLKVNIRQTNRNKKTYIIGNFYRSHLRNLLTFLTHLISYSQN